jgi:predicted ArsR family transcriptional regulator
MLGKPRLSRCQYDVVVALEPGAEFSAVVAAVTSAFGDPTRREVYLYARESPIGVTATQVARRFSLHPNVARHHLDKLAAGGYLEVASDHGQRGAARSAGRPSKRYRASGPAPVLGIPKREDELLLALLAGALALLPDREAEEMAERVGFDYGTKLAAAMGSRGHRGDSHRSFRAALQAVADALTAHGFAAHAEARGRTLALVKEACPFLEEARQHPVICAVDRGMVKGMLQALSGSEPAPAQWSSRAMGDAACTTSLPTGA